MDGERDGGGEGGRGRGREGEREEGREGWRGRGRKGGREEREREEERLCLTCTFILPLSLMSGRIPSLKDDTGAVSPH